MRTTLQYPSKLKFGNSSKSGHEPAVSKLHPADTAYREMTRGIPINHKNTLEGSGASFVV